MLSMRYQWILFVGLLVADLGSGNAQTAPPADWTAAVFPERSHEFGTVARGSKVRHSFPIVNSTNEILHIKSWRTKCGCTDVKVGAREIPPGTQTTLEAVIDTTNYTGYKPSGLILSLDQPTPIDIDFNLTCFIRTDLTLAPGQVDFGVVNRSSAPEAQLSLIYAGTQADWAISSAFTISEHITANLQSQGRSAAGPVSYHLTVKLNPSVPVGYFKDEITLKTNDPTGPTIPISVAAIVQSNVTVTPSVINVGAVRPGETVQKTFVVRAAQPFKVIAIESNRSELALAAAPAESRPLHALQFTFKAPEVPGAFNASVEIQTDLKDEPPAKLMVFATIVP